MTKSTRRDKNIPVSHTRRKFLTLQLSQLVSHVLSENTEQGLLWVVAGVQCASLIEAVHIPLVVDYPMVKVEAAKM